MESGLILLKTEVKSLSLKRDERSLLNNVPFGDLSSVESIEVLKGAASVLSLHSVMGGVINILRKKAGPDFTAVARLSYGICGVFNSSSIPTLYT